MDAPMVGTGNGPPGIAAAANPVEREIEPAIRLVRAKPSVTR